MNIDDAKKYILEHSSDILQPDNSSKNKPKNSKNYGYECPICHSGTHSANGTGMTTKDGIHFTCWAGCFSNADIIEILAKRDGYESESFITQLKHACKEFNIRVEGMHSKQSQNGYPLDWNGEPIIEQVEDAPKTPAPIQPATVSEPIKTHSLEGDKTPVNESADDVQIDLSQLIEWNENRKAQKCDYLTKRGISEEIQDKFLIGYCENWKHPKLQPHTAKFISPTPRIIIPIGTSAYIARDIRPDVKESEQPYIKSKVGHVRTFNEFALMQKQNCFVVEGEIDALSMIELGFNACALGSTAYINKFIDALKAIEPEERAPLLILALDNDDAGIKATNDLMKRLDEIGMKYTVPNVKEIYGECKDANDALLQDRAGFEKRLKHLCKTREELYNDKSAKNLALDFLNDYLNNENPKPISTGFANLDEQLDGGLFEGLYFMGAISSLGKTTLALQIADNIAKAGRDVLIFSLEMSKRELLAKSISRLTMQSCDFGADVFSHARSVRDLTTYKEKNDNNQNRIIQKAIKDYTEFAEHIFILEGLGDVTVDRVRAAVAEHVICRKQKPVVFIDYLQIIAPDDVRATDKQNTDKAVLELKRLSRDYKIPVFAVSSLNRENYSKPISMQAFKESGAIEYSSDVLIGLQFKGVEEVKKNEEFDVNAAKNQFPRDIELKVLKNRNGKTGNKVDFVYYQNFNNFDEV